jgi:hypothetical protein
MTLDSLHTDLGITWEAKFVPFSQSRNAVPKPRISDLNLNWKILLRTDRYTMSVDYMQGIGHVPKFKHKARYTLHDEAYIRHACEAGLMCKDPDHLWLKGPAIPPPKLKDVLYCLVMDLGVLDYPEFEEWARDTGYNPDSIKDKKLYKECRQQALRTRLLLGDANIRLLQGVFQDH